jgi:hypothetical protein
MMIWGGFDAISELDGGGAYEACEAVDLDGDTHTLCEGDCNDGDSSIHPGAIEVCNSADDNCDGTTDNVVLGRPTLTVGKSGTTAVIAWPASPGADGYDVVKGNLGTLRSSGGNFTSATKACLGNDLPGTTVDDIEVPPVSGGLWYLARTTSTCAGAGTYDEESLSQQGSRDQEIANSQLECP